MSVLSLRSDGSPTLAAELIGAVSEPARAYPLLLERGRSAEVFLFSAVSGVYVAFSAAQRLHLGDRFGFALTAVGVLVLGVALGIFAMTAAGALLRLSSEAVHGHPYGDRTYSVFGYATWPFLPLLVILLPVEYAAYGTRIFSATRPDAGPLPVIVAVMEALAILLWLYLMITGIAAAAALTRTEAAKALALGALEMVVVGVLLLVIVFVSFLI